jgi:hypothetical protein
MFIAHPCCNFRGGSQNSFSQVLVLIPDDEIHSVPEINCRVQSIPKDLEYKITVAEYNVMIGFGIPHAR